MSKEVFNLPKEIRKTLSRYFDLPIGTRVDYQRSHCKHRWKVEIGDILSCDLCGEVKKDD